MELRQLLACSRCNSTGESRYFTHGDILWSRYGVIQPNFERAAHSVVAYQTRAPPVGESSFIYVLKGSVTEVCVTYFEGHGTTSPNGRRQGRMPHDVFEDEPAEPTGQTASNTAQDIPPSSA